MAMKAHHVGSPPTHFQNPWPSYRSVGRWELLSTRFSKQRNFVPVPETRDELVKVRKPDWGSILNANKTKMKATWLGHASWLIETGAIDPSGGSDTDVNSRGIRVLFDPVFSERTSPFKSIGPKRYTPTPCGIEELPEVDAVCISHNHYDHLDLDTITFLHSRSKKTRYLCGLGNKDWFVSLGIDPSLVHELDWWDACTMSVRNIGAVNFMCTPAQHSSARGPFDKDKTLWCSWALGENPELQSNSLDQDVIIPTHPSSASSFGNRRLYFAGDTGYRTVDVLDPTPEQAAQYPHCPAFKEIGTKLGPFDLALLPIGLFLPRNVMSTVHCSPEDSVCVHKDIRSKRSIGMHFGTIRGGISGQYEDVREPPRRWKKACEVEGLRFGNDEQAEAGLCDVGETLVVS